MSPNRSEHLLGRVLRKLFPPHEGGSYDELDWQQDIDRARVEQNPIRTRALLYSTAAITLSLLIWSGFAEIDQVTRGQGKVIPSRQIQVVQSLDGGVVKEIHVSEGEVVEKGQLLVKIDATRFASSFRETEAERLALRAKAERLTAITEGRDFTPDPQLQQDVPDIVAQQLQLHDANQRQLNALENIAAQQLTQREQELIEATARFNQLQRAYDLAYQELRVTRPLVSSGAVSEVELLRLEREVNKYFGEKSQTAAQIVKIESAINEARASQQEVRLKFLNQLREELSTTLARLSTLDESSKGLSDRVKQTDVRSPVRGTVKHLYINTLGGVVLPGREVVDIVPLDDTLLLETRIEPKDIGFLRPGQRAMVRFTAYDFVVYGGMDAVVEQIGADTLTDDKGNPYYLVKVRTHSTELGDNMPIIPGMVAEVDVLTGKKTILAYLLKPVLRAQQYAMTES